MRKIYRSSQETGAPLSGAHEFNGLVYVSGQIHVNTSGELVGDTIEEKLEVVIVNIKNILNDANLELDDVISLQIYMTDLKQLPALNKAYSTFFKHPLPTRAAVEVSALPLGASLEICVIAARQQ
ncbi:MAG: RidA family protein [Candidatus Komeilibacteria bacterium]|nr:RidA family protein [Candidatus Komeilibacteria bacterium]